MSALGPVELIIVLGIVPFLAVPLWAIVDAMLRPDSQWAAVDQNKVLWVVLMAIGMFVLGPVALVVAIVYLVSVRPKLRRTA